MKRLLNSGYIAVTIGTALGVAIGIVTHFATILQWLSYILLGLLALVLLIGLVWLIIWRDRKRDELHERWFMKGAETGVKVVVATVQGEADRHQAMGKVTVETVKLLKAAGTLDNGQPPLFLPGALTMADKGSFVEGDYNVIHGLNDDEPAVMGDNQ